MEQINNWDFFTGAEYAQHGGIFVEYVDNFSQSEIEDRFIVSNNSDGSRIFSFALFDDENGKRMICEFVVIHSTANVSDLYRDLIDVADRRLFLSGKGEILLSHFTAALDLF